jgi:hypothetical protein
MNLDEILRLQVLKLKSSQAGRGSFLEAAFEQEEAGMPVRQMCAKVSHELYEEVDNVCGFLDMSKREFIEAAVVEAVKRAHHIIREHGGLDALVDVVESSKS